MFTEGEKTEPIYLQHWHRLHRQHVVVSISEFHGTPMALVDRAVKEKVADLREAKRGRGNPYDQYWCVFDLDVHPKVREAVTLAERNGIQIGLSN